MTYKTRGSTLSNSTLSGFMPLTIRQRTAWRGLCLAHITVTSSVVPHLNVCDQETYCLFWLNEWSLFHKYMPSVFCIIDVCKCVGGILHKWNQWEKILSKLQSPGLTSSSIFTLCETCHQSSNCSKKKSLTDINLVHLKQKL